MPVVIESELESRVERDGDEITVVNAANPTEYSVTMSLDTFVEAVEDALEAGSPESFRGGDGPMGSALVGSYDEGRIEVGKDVYRPLSDTQIGFIEGRDFAWVLGSELEAFVESLQAEA